MKAINNFGFPIKLYVGNYTWGIMPFDGRVYDIPDIFYDKYHPIMKIVQMPKPKVSENVDSIDINLEDIFSEAKIDEIIKPKEEKKVPKKRRTARQIAKRNEASKRLKEDSFMSYHKNKEESEEKDGHYNN